MGVDVRLEDGARLQRELRAEGEQGVPAPVLHGLAGFPRTFRKEVSEMAEPSMSTPVITWKRPPGYVSLLRAPAIDAACEGGSRRGGA